MCRSDELLSYSAFPAGHIFRLGIAVIVLTGNCVVMRIAATFALASIQGSQAYCAAHQLACSVSAYSVLGSLLPNLMAVTTGAFSIVAAKRFYKWAFIVTFALGCVAMTLCYLLNLLFNGLRHGYNIAPILVPDILEILLFTVINLLTMVLGILCVKSLVKDRSQRYLARESDADVTPGPSTSGRTAGSSRDYDNFDDDGHGGTAVVETAFGDSGRSRSSRGRDNEALEVGDEDEEGAYENPDPDDGSSGNSLRPQSSGSGGRRLGRVPSGLSPITESRVEAELTVVVENESGKVTNFDIFTINGGGGGSGENRRKRRK